VAAVAAFLVFRGPGERPAGWPLPNADAAGTRSARGSNIGAANVHTLHVAWRFPLDGYQTVSGIFASTPVASGGRVYVQDLDSDVFAIDERTGRRLWVTHARQVDGGPNGVAFAGGRVFGNTARAAFALDADTGRVLWRTKLVHSANQTIDIAPLVQNGLVFTSTVGVPKGGKGVLYALDAGTGRVVWQFSTVLGDWAVPGKAAGGGAWWPFSVDGAGRVYAGTANPVPWGGSPRLPNGGAYAGRDLYTDSLLSLDGKTGKLRWYFQATPHDVRDYDLGGSPVLVGPTVYVAGKAGIVYALDASSGRVLWRRPVGRHENDTGPLPRHRVLVCPGLYGGVETPMAYADDRLFVPVVDLCMKGSAVGYEPIQNVDIPSRGSGELVALDAANGRPAWTDRFPVPLFGCATVANDVVFVSSLDGHLYGVRTSDGRVLWQARMRAAVNACPAVVGDELLVGAGADYPTLANARYELAAFRLG